METELTVAALAGLLAPWLTAILTQVELRSSYKRLIAIAVTLLLVGVGIFATYRPDTWQEIATVIAAALGVMQVVYTAMKPVLDAVEIRINPGEEAAAHENNQVVYVKLKPVLDTGENKTNPGEEGADSEDH